jgi:hypothetical protein
MTMKMMTAMTISSLMTTTLIERPWDVVKLGPLSVGNDVETAVRC